MTLSQVKAEICYSFHVETFKDWLDKELRERGWLAADLARASGLAEATISRIASGSRGLGVDSLIAIANALDVDPADVLRQLGRLGPSISELRQKDAPLDHAFRQLAKLRARDTADFAAAARMIDGLLLEERLPVTATGPPGTPVPIPPGGDYHPSREQLMTVLRFVLDQAWRFGFANDVLRILEEHARISETEDLTQKAR